MAILDFRLIGENLSDLQLSGCQRQCSMNAMSVELEMELRVATGLAHAPQHGESVALRLRVARLRADPRILRRQVQAGLIARIFGSTRQPRDSSIYFSDEHRGQEGRPDE
jgi:hypothetical protein